MKNEELDRLFRHKFEQLEAQPTPQAWKQLQEQLQHKKKQKKWGYLSGIAASLLLLFGLWATLEYSSSIVPTSPLAREQENKAPQAPAIPQESEALAEQQTAIPSTDEATGKENQSAHSAKSTSPKSTDNSNKPMRPAQNIQAKTPVQKPAQKPAQNAVSTAKEAQPPIAELPRVESKPELINSIAEAGADIKIEEPSLLPEQVIIRYKADAEEEKPVLASIKQAEDKELSARRVMGFLKKVKENSNGSLAELREAKDDLLSLRFGRAN
jgi:SepF-like predicted cell division protein (DUF552 family)